MALVRLQPDAVLPLLCARVGDIAPRAMVVGDPARAAKAAGLLEGARQIGENREYATFVGKYKGVDVTIASHGIGGAGAAVCFEELARSGVQRIIRSGTAGGLQPEVVDGHIVVATGAVRMDGVTHQMVPPEFPALADPELAVRLKQTAAAAGAPAHYGVVLTSAIFYPYDLVNVVDQHQWQRAGVVAVEMEAATLFVVAALNGIEAGGVFAIDGNPLQQTDESMSDYDPHREVVTKAVDAALFTALEALVA